MQITKGRLEKQYSFLIKCRAQLYITFFPIFLVVYSSITFHMTII